MLSETWLTPLLPDGLYSLTGYTLLRRDRVDRRGGGVCVYVSDHILSNFRVSPVSFDACGIEALFCEISNKDVSFVLGCVYRPPSSSVGDVQHLTDFISNLASRHEKTFVFGDFNMPDIHWPLETGRSHGPSSQLMVDLLIDSHLIQMVSQPTRYRCDQSPSLLDLIISSDDNSLTNLEYLDPIGTSDHLTLRVKLQICFIPQKRTVSLSRTEFNYEAISRSLSNLDWKTILSNASVSENWDRFKNILQDTLDRNSIIYTFRRSSKKPWISGKILKLVRRKRALWRAYKRSGTEADYKSHRLFSNQVSSVIRDARIKYEDRLANTKDPKRLYKHIRSKLSGPVGSLQLKDPSGTVMDNSCDVANAFANTFSSVFTADSGSSRPVPKGPRCSSCLIDIDFSESAMCEKLKRLGVCKSPGPDLIEAKILKNCAEALSGPITILARQSFRSGSLPVDWRSATVRPIFKKGSKFDPNNYRPISLTSIVVKIVESVIYEQMVKFFQDNGVIPDEQHGFLPGKSIQSNLLCCLSDWTRETDRGNSVDVLYLDFSKAFDRVPRRHLLLKLEHVGIRGALLKWIESFLSDRNFRVKVGGSFSELMQVVSGVPQGSVLGPLLFLAYTADIKNSIVSPFSMYADDIKLYNISDNGEILRRDLLAVCEWSSRWLLPLNSDKCSVLYIGSGNPKIPYHIDGKVVVPQDCVKDLGVFICSDLSWSSHVAHIVKKANSILFLLSKVFCKASPGVFSKLYKTFVRPILEFGNSVWTPILQRDILLLESLQRKATRIPFGRYRPQYPQRLSSMKLSSLHERRNRGDLITIFQALSNPQSPIRHLFVLNTDSRTRRHRFKLLKDKFATRSRQYFITNRVFDLWNSLPNAIIDAQSVTSFKIRYDTFCAQLP